MNLGPQSCKITIKCKKLARIFKDLCLTSPREDSLIFLQNFLSQTAKIHNSTKKLTLDFAGEKTHITMNFYKHLTKNSQEQNFLKFGSELQGHFCFQIKQRLQKLQRLTSGFIVQYLKNHRRNKN